MFGKTFALLSILSLASATDCDTLKGCYLRNLETGKEIELTGSNSYKLESSKANDYSIRCAVNQRDGESDFIKFMYDGKEHEEFNEPRWLDGDSNKGAYIVPVPYLATCGVKQIQIEGHVWSQLCFAKSFTLTAQCDGSMTTAPVAKATKAPTKAPITRAPSKAPVTRAPTKSPITVAPTKAPVTAAPTKQPIRTTESPILTAVPAEDETNAPVAAPAAMPVPAIVPVSQQPVAAEIVPLKIATLTPTALPTSNNLEAIPSQQLPTQPRSKCKKVGFKMVSGYCVRSWCAADFKCGRGMQRIPGRDCYNDKKDCTCAKGYVKRLGGGQCRLKAACKYGRNWLGRCKSCPPVTNKRAQFLMKPRE
jgi:hypothetical protein